MLHNLILLTLLCMETLLFARESGWTLLEARHASMDYGIIDYYRDAYMPEYTTVRGKPVYRSHDKSTVENPEQWAYSAAVNFDLDLIKLNDTGLFWDNRVHMTATTAQVRHVGWEWRFGFDLVPGSLQVFYHHHSQHVMERQTKGNTNNLEPRSGADWEIVNENAKGYPVLDEYVLRITFIDKNRGKE